MTAATFLWWVQSLMPEKWQVYSLLLIIPLPDLLVTESPSISTFSIQSSLVKMKQLMILWKAKIFYMLTLKALQGFPQDVALQVGATSAPPQPTPKKNKGPGEPSPFQDAEVPWTLLCTVHKWKFSLMLRQQRNLPEVRFTIFTLSKVLQKGCVRSSSTCLIRDWTNCWL